MVEVEPSGMVTFRLFRPEAQRVEVRGEFTHWRPGALNMKPAGDGWWEAKMRVVSGDHQFSYFVDESVWLPDYAATGIRANGFGGWVSVLHVASARRGRRAA